MKTRAEAQAGGYSDSVRRLSVAADAQRPSRRVVRRLTTLSLGRRRRRRQAGVRVRRHTVVASSDFSITKTRYLAVVTTTVERITPHSRRMQPHRV